MTPENIEVTTLMIIGWVLISFLMVWIAGYDNDFF